MNKKNIDNKIPIYRLTSKKKIIEYYDKWVIKNKYNKDMIDWNYVAPKNSVDLFCKYAISKKIKILDDSGIYVLKSLDQIGEEMLKIISKS